ncbi:hypothetical protein [Hydrotalea sp.]|uniref:hypothetical protein n=1 Tax=Hydrotalea sp. TaxID=2881279 RepID=UPI003D13B9BD
MNCLHCRAKLKKKSSGRRDCAYVDSFLHKQNQQNWLLPIDITAQLPRPPYVHAS